jgi:hypothetical protein
MKPIFRSTSRVAVLNRTCAFGITVNGFRDNRLIDISAFPKDV